MNKNIDYLIEINKKQKKLPLIIIFGGLRGEMIIPVFEFRKVFSNHINHFHFIFLRDMAVKWYSEGIKGLGSNVDEVVSSLKEIIKKEKDKISEIYTIGVSMGGYASILFGVLLNVDKIVSFVPQTFIDKKNRKIYKDNRYKLEIPRLEKKYFDLKKLNIKKFLNNKKKMYIIIGEDELDIIHANRLKNIKNIKLIKYKNKDHTIVKSLRDSGELNKLINKIFPKKKILHIHYSGIVRNRVLLNYLLKYKNIGINEKGSVYFSKKKENKKKIKKKILKKISVRKDVFKNIGELWYYIIKNKNFIFEYNRLIIYEMEKQGIKEIEFRIKLGSYFNEKNKKIGIEKELLLFYECYKKLYKKENKIFKIICAISKSLNKKIVYNYFIEIINILEKYKYLKEIIIGFDLVGDEISGNSLFYYEDIIKEIKKKTDIPFYFHAGENDNKKSIDNIKFALKYGGERIAHGIYCIRDKSIMKEIKKKKIILEISPISNLILGNIKDNLIYYKLYKYGIKLSINTDDPNKLNDSTLYDNEKFLLNHGFSESDINFLYEEL